MTKIASIFFSQIMQDNDGGFSSKRVVTFYALLLISIGFFANLFGGYKVEQFMFDAVMFIVIAGLGFSGAEKFAPNRTPSAPPTPDALPPVDMTQPTCPSCGAPQQ